MMRALSCRPNFFFPDVSPVRALIMKSFFSSGGTEGRHPGQDGSSTGNARVATADADSTRAGLPPVGLRLVFTLERVSGDKARGGNPRPRRLVRDNFVLQSGRKVVA